MGKQWKHWQTFLGSKITADGDYSHEIKRYLLLGRKAVTNLDSILKSRDITLQTKVCIVIAMVFPVVMSGFDSWTIKKHLQFSSVESLSHVQVFVIPWATACRPPCPSPTPGDHPNPCPLSWWCYLTISSSVVPFSFCLNISQHQGLFQWVSFSHQVAKVLEFQLQHQSLQWTPRTDLL